MKHIFFTPLHLIRLLCLITLMIGNLPTAQAHAHTTDAKSVQNTYVKPTIIERIQKAPAALMQYLRSHRIIAGTTVLITGAGISAYYLFKKSDTSPVSATHAATSGSATQKHNQTGQGKKQDLSKNNTHSCTSPISDQVTQSNVVQPVSAYSASPSDFAPQKRTTTPFIPVHSAPSPLAAIYPAKEKTSDDSDDDKCLFLDRTMRIQEVQQLLDAHPDRHYYVDTVYKITLAMIAASKNDIEMLDLLLHIEKQRLNDALPTSLFTEVDIAGLTALMCTTLTDTDSNNAAALLIKLGVNLDAQDIEDTSALMHAINSDHTGIAQQLIDAGANLTLQDSNGKTALILAAQKGNDTIVRKLLKKGAPVNTRDSMGNTALAWAAASNHYVVVQKLIEATADLNTQDIDGNTPLIWAVLNDQNAAAQTLINAHANPNLHDIKGHTALTYASKKGDIHMMKLLIDNTANIEATTTNSNSALMLATKHGHYKATQLLVGAKAHLETRNNYGETPLIAASRRHNTITQLLLDSKAQTDTQDNLGETALICAVQNNNNVTVQSLVDANADTEKRDVYNKTALMYAKKYKHDHLIPILTQNQQDPVGQEYEEEDNDDDEKSLRECPYSHSSTATKCNHRSK